jgi:hypothetical protein
VKAIIFAVCAAVLLSGCVSSHKWGEDDDPDWAIEMDRFKRKIENKDSLDEKFILDKDCIDYFKAHPELDEDSMKITVFPIAYGKSKVVRGDERLECDFKVGFWLGLWCRGKGAVAFDEYSGDPVGVAHIKLDRLLGLLYSAKGEIDFESETRAGRSRWLLGAFGKTKTHSGKKRSYYFWIPFEHKSEKKDVGAAK